MIYTSLKDLPDFDLYLVDAYGPFVGAAGVSQAAIQVMADLVAAGKKVCVLSNASELAGDAVSRYHRKGLLSGVHYNSFMTSGQFVYEAIQRGALPVPGNKFYVFGVANFRDPEKLPTIFNDSVYEVVDTVQEADFAYCGIPQINGEDRMEITEFVPGLAEIKKAGLALVCANPDLRANKGGRFVVRQGIICEAYEQMGGKVIRYGKPDARIFDRVLADYGIARERVLMIGDTLGTDILGANRAGIKSCLVLDGGMTEYALEQRGWAVTEENIAALAHAQGAIPDYVCRRMSEAELF